MSSKIIHTDIELKDALKMYKKGIPKIKIAEKYNTTRIKIFKQLKEKYPHEILRNEEVVQNRLISKEQYDNTTKDDIEKILEYFGNGVTINKIASIFNVKSNVISRILKQNNHENRRESVLIERYRNKMNQPNNDELYEEMNRFL